MLVFMALLIMAVLVFFFFADRMALGRFYITPVAIVIFFVSLQHLSTVLYSLNDSYLERYVFGQIDNSFKDYGSLVYLYFIYFLIVFLSCSAAFLGYYGKEGVLHKAISRVLLFDRDMRDRKAAIYGGALFVVGLLTYLYFIKSIGGLSSLWQQLYMRTQLTAGTGYLSLAYSSLCTMGFFFMYRYLVIKSKFFLVLFFLIMVFILVSLGQRGPVISFVFSIVVYHSYRLGSINKFFSLKGILVATFCLFIMVGLAQFRKPGFVNEFLESPVVMFHNVEESILNNFIFRMGRLERDLVYVRYFDENDYWLGKGYLSLIFAPVPSSIMIEKPPLDTGVYIYNIAKGYDVEPPMPTIYMQPTSWPEGNWAGYSNFGPLGLLLLVTVSSWLFGFFGKLVIVNNFNIFPTVFFSLLAFGGVPSLSPYGIYGIFSVLVPVVIAAFFGLCRFSGVRDSVAVSSKGVAGR